MNREQWLNDLSELIRPDFAQIKQPVPKKLKITCSWPTRGALSKKKRTLGQYFPPECSKNGWHEIFITPFMDEVIQVGHVLVHELVHAVVYPIGGHRGPFRNVAIQMGLIGKMTSTEAGDELRNQLAKYCKQLGKYPHSAVDSTPDDGKKQKTYLIKIECEECNCCVRMTRKWIDEVGLPTCGCGGTMEEVM